MNIYSKIEEQLDCLLNLAPKDYSFYTGKTGIAFCYFLLAKNYNSLRNISVAQREIDEVISNFTNIDSASFSRGLLGIGWGVEAMAQNGYIKFDTNVLLADFDDFIYQQSTFYQSVSLSLDNGCLGKALYFYQRVLSKSPAKLRFRHLLNQECLFLLVNEMKYFLLDSKVGLLKQYISLSKVQIIDIAQSAILLFKIYQLRLVRQIIEPILREIILFIEKIFDDPSLNPLIQHLYLLHSYSFIAASFANVEMQKRYNYWLNIYTSCCYNKEANPIDKYIANMYCNRNTYTGEQIDNASLCELFTMLNNNNTNASWKQAWLIG